MKKTYLILVLLLPLLAHAQYKSEYDIKENSPKKISGTASINDDYAISDSLLEITMLEDGYFTIGTTNGTTESVLDDNCEITFGHPYAKTSFPVFYLGDDRYRLEELFADRTFSPVISGDTLTIAAADARISIAYTMILNRGSGSVTLKTAITNLASVEQKLGTGLVLDPALGKWGDGYALAEGEYVTKETTSYGALETLEIIEKRSSAKGIRIQLDFPSAPDDVISFLNWGYAREFNPWIVNEHALMNIFDLALVHNAAEALAPGETLEREIKISLLEPDFSSPLFARWDMTQFLTLDHGLMFPDRLTATLELYNTTDTDKKILSIGAQTPWFVNFTPLDESVTVAAGSYGYAYVSAEVDIIYEDKIVDLALWLDGNAETFEIVNRRLLIPETPVSNTGLTIVDDSLAAFNHPEMELVFSAVRDETGALVRNLSHGNIFLYENGLRINEFDLSKYDGSGISEADIVFVLDVTGSMGGEILMVRDNIDDFVSNLAERGLEAMVGLVTYRRNVVDTYPLTRDIEAFKEFLGNSISTSGSIENALDALSTAAKFDFRPTSKRTVIWLTDEPYNENDDITALTAEDVVDEMLLEGIVVHNIGLIDHKGDYDRITVPTGGKYFDINSDFEDIFLNLSDYDTGSRYSLKYTSANNSGENLIELQVRYAGLGGDQSYTYSPPGRTAETSRLAYYPNPFNPTINFKVNLQHYTTGKLRIFNLLGQQVKEFILDNRSTNTVTWNAVNESGNLVSSGFYFVQLSLADGRQNIHTESAKILFLK